MLDKDVTIGMKVVPHDKTIGFGKGLHNSSAWNEHGGCDQGYLFVNEHFLGSENMAECWVLTVMHPVNRGGDFFNASDFEPLKKLYEDFHPMVTTDEFGHMIFG